MNRPALLAMLCGVVAAPAGAETLTDALAAAYHTNPRLLAQRAQQQVTDETYVQAETGLRPTLSASGAVQRGVEPNDTADLAEGVSNFNDGQAALTLSQPLYTGGQTTWAIRQAKARVLAGREGLRGVEAAVFQAAIQAYVDVLRDQDVLAVRHADLDTLQRQADEAKAKFDLGQVTRTDVFQAQTQLEAARAALSAAQAQLEVSRAEYAAAIGQAPGPLSAPENLPGLPKTVDEAFDLAEASNAGLDQSRLTEQASRAAIAEAQSAYRPTVSASASFGYIGPASPLRPGDYDRNALAQVTIAQPLLTGGLRASNVRSAIAQNASDRINIEAARRAAVQQTAQAWYQLLAGQQQTVANQAQVTAAEDALKGVQLEYGYGLRSTLDVLIADQNLRSAQVALAGSRHDTYVAEAQVLSAVGRLEAAWLLPNEPHYDPAQSFDKVRRSGALPWDGVVSGLDSLGAPPAPDR
jgi:outer membrane protein